MVILDALGASVGGLGSLWGLCGRSLVDIGASLDGLGLLWEPLWAAIGPKVAQALIGEQSWDHSEKCPKPERHRDRGQGIAAGARPGPRPPYAFCLSICIAIWRDGINK